VISDMFDLFSVSNSPT